MKKRIFYESLPYYFASLALHLIGIALLAITALHNASFWGLGLLAYTLGLRHAFDADHIAAIDNTVRKLIQEKQKSVGVGFFFSLGHSTVVFLMALIVGLSVKFAKLKLPILQAIGGKIGSLVSGLFLLIIAVSNFLILFSLFSQLKDVRKGYIDEDKLNDLLTSRGFLSKLLGPLFKIVKHSWQMYPVGFLFGLGFDTATEIALIALSAGTASANASIWGIMSLPVLFAAGMNLMDTTDSVMMSGAYAWAFDTPIRKIYYNVIVTSVSVIAAFVIGSIELLQVISSGFSVRGKFWEWVQNIDFNWLGYGLILIFLIMWLIAYLGWRMIGKKREKAKL
ncbi:HoxN/HupN/NixA family nickel/cobalt transporter [Ligilactobacillus acidipiscis]|uniref:HoxN/HupN/NixA family nickel/cobalt transporter n=1 Tax=Ligilactobacillus acidipiscis TaxID=89059 RepID=UPI0023F621A7|nr:HoxN/HupN/NixA family nickel/cobalt transporter [Ligilactobacillus acidipiscis]WEV57516.1 HoxN/HupN/NixA family nickel/cobalt transporter [Ligilactobacillus acidipiscis]